MDDDDRSDAALIASGQAESFGIVFDRHFATIHRYLERRLGRDGADDLAAEVFRVAFEQRRRFRPLYESALPWLYGLATNLTMKHRRSEARRLRALARLETGRYAGDPGLEGADDRIEAQAARGRLLEALSALPIRDRDVLVLVAWEELSYDEVAAALDIPAGTVRSRLNRARHALRDVLAESDPNLAVNTELGGEHPMIDELELLRQARPPAAGPGGEPARRAREQLLSRIGDRRATRQRARRRALRIAIPALAAIVAAVVLGLKLPGDGADAAWAAAAIRVAEEAPRLLVGDPAWRVSRADEFSVDYGEMTFVRGDRELEVRWEPAREFEHLVRDRGVEADLATTARAAGADVRLFGDSGGFTALWLHGDHVIEARGEAEHVDAFKAVLATLHEVDVDTWLSAMPPNVVKPAGRAGVVDEMLAGIPLPEGFDSSPLRQSDAVSDRYQVGARVAGAVVCAWIDQWVSARRSGDDEAVRQAVDAMAGSRSWRVLLEMDDQGAFPEVVWEYAHAMATGALIPGGRWLTVEESYRQALGCEHA